MAPFGASRAGLMSVRGDAIPDSVTNRWPMDEGSGTTLADDVGSTNANLVGGTWVSDTSSVGGSHTDYDGVDDRWDTPSFGINGSEYTFMTWVRWDSVNDLDTIASATDSSFRNGWALTLDGSQNWRINHLDDSFDTAVSLSESPATETWYFAAAVGVDDEATIYVYDNNNLIATDSGTSTRTTGDRELYGMAANGETDRNINGQADAPAVSTTTALTQSEIEDYWQATQR